MHRDEGGTEREYKRSKREKRGEGGEGKRGRGRGRKRAMPTLLLVKPKLGMINDR